MAISLSLRRAALITTFALLAAPCANATRVYIDFGDGNFPNSGNFFALGDSHDVDVDNDSSAGPINIGFGIDFGAGTFNSLYINENGLVSFGAAINGYTSVASLADLGAPVIAPYYADLVSAAVDNDDATIIPGQVFYSSGQADPYPNSAGEYSTADLVPAFRVTWYGASSATDPNARVYTQLYLYSLGGGDFDLRLTYGNPDVAGGSVTPSLGELAGFSLGAATTTVTDPMSLTTDYVFSYRGGQLVGGTPPTTVPEPSDAALAAGGGLALIALFFKRRRRLAADRPR
jgi:hypothetical protein